MMICYRIFVSGAPLKEKEAKRLLRPKRIITIQPEQFLNLRKARNEILTHWQLKSFQKVQNIHKINFRNPASFKMKLTQKHFQSDQFQVSDYKFPRKVALKDEKLKILRKNLLF